MLLLTPRGIPSYTGKPRTKGDPNNLGTAPTHRKNSLQGSYVIALYMRKMYNDCPAVNEWRPYPMNNL